MKDPRVKAGGSRGRLRVALEELEQLLRRRGVSMEGYYIGSHLVAWFPPQGEVLALLQEKSWEACEARRAWLAELARIEGLRGTSTTRCLPSVELRRARARARLMASAAHLIYEGALRAFKEADDAYRGRRSCPEEVP